MKTSLCVTILNESKTIKLLLDSIFQQTVLFNEIIFVDGGSIDNTVAIILDYIQQSKIAVLIKKNKIHFLVTTKKGNRSVGRNYAIKLATNNLILITDAGCILDKNWASELLKKYQQSGAPVVAGYYASQTKTNFQKAVVPYVLVMPDKVDENNFLPATRSMLIEKNLFIKMGGFDEKLTDNEDYAFAKKLQKNKVKISFAKRAVVNWMPVKTVNQFYTMIFRFARGDVFAGIIRPKVILIFARYLLWLLLLIVAVLFNLLNSFFWFLLFAIILYTFWAIGKNKKYVSDGWIYLPILQIISDSAVMWGSINGAILLFSESKKSKKLSI